MTHAHRHRMNLGSRMTFKCLTRLFVFVASLVFAARAQAQLGTLGQDFQLTIDSQFLTVNDNFFEQIGIDFDFKIGDGLDDSQFGFVELNDSPITVLDIPVSLAQTRLESEGAVFPDPVANGPAEIGGSTSFSTAIGFDTIPRTTLTFDLRSGITATPGTAGRVQNQGVAALKLNIPLNVTGNLEFEVETSFDADIVEPSDGKFGLGALVELSTNISEFRFFGPAQRFFFESDKLGPFGNLYSTSDFTNDKGVLLFRGQNTIQFMIDPADIVAEQVFFQVYNDILLQNFGMTSAQVDAAQTASFTLRSLTPGVTFQKSLAVPEPGTLWLVAVGLFWLGTSRSFGDVRHFGAQGLPTARSFAPSSSLSLALP